MWENRFRLNEKEKKMKKKLKVIGLIAICVAGGLLYYFIKIKEEKPVLFETEKSQQGYIANSITSTGTIQPVDTVAVGTQVSGTIKNIYADFNSVVKKGQLLAVLDKSLFNAQVAQYLSSFQGATGQLAYEQQNLNRQTQLYQAGAISKSDYETAQNLYSQAKGAAGSAQAQLTTAKKNLAYASISSPIDGTVLSRNISEGQTVAASFNTPTLYTIAKDLTKMQVRAAVDEADIGNIKAGQQVKFTVDAFPEDTFPGSVQEIRLDPVVTSNVVTYTTIINAPNETLKLKPGMTASITIIIEFQNHAQLLPAKATSFYPPNQLAGYSIVDETKNLDSIHVSGLLPQTQKSKISSVWVLNGKQLTKKNILTGLNDDIHVQVLDGLDKNDRVVVGLKQNVDKASSVTSRSPFMPTRRPQGTKK